MSSHHRWIVLLSCCLVQTVLNGFMYALGKLFLDIMDTFNTTRAEASLVQSINIGVSRGGGFIWGLVVSRLGPRKAGFTAAIVATAGLLSCYFSTSLAQVVVGMAVASAGSATSFISVSFATSQQFDGKTNAIALSLLSTVSGVGSIIFSYSLGFLSDTYGLRGTFLIVSGLAFQGFACSWLWGPPLWHPRKSINSKIGDTNGVPSKVETPSGPCTGRSDNHHDLRSCVTATVERAIQNEKNMDSFTSAPKILSETKQGVVTKTVVIPESLLVSIQKCNDCNQDIGNKNLRKERDNQRNENSNQRNKNSSQQSEDSNQWNESSTQWNENNINQWHKNNNQKNGNNNQRNETVLDRLKVVLNNRRFIFVSVGFIVGYPSISVLNIFLTDIIVDRGFSENQGSLAFILYTTFNVIGRLSSGLLMQIPKVTAFSVPLIGCLLGLLSIGSLTLVHSITLVMIASCIGGTGQGLLISALSVTAAAIAGRAYLPEAMGSLLTSMGLSTVFAGPLSGYIRDQTGTYTVSLLCAAAASLLACIAFFLGQCTQSPSDGTNKKRTSVFYVTQM